MMMHSVRIHNVIDQMISLFRRIGIWHEEDVPSLTQLRVQSFCCIYYLFFCVSVLIGAITKETVDESVFLAEVFLIVTVFWFKIWFIFWKQKEIMLLLNRVCVFTIRNDEELAFFNEKVEKFIKFVDLFVYATIATFLGCAVFPFLGKNRSFIVDFAFPLDWKNSEIGFCTAYIFLFIGMILSVLGLTFSFIIWYVLLHCSLRYKILGMEIRSMGRITISGKRKVTEKEQQNVFYQDLWAAIDAHVHLRKIIDEVESFLSKLFLLQFATSGLCICGSIYCLAFGISDNNVERLIHVYSLLLNIGELFMITYLGNEIKLSSGRLTYSLFECEWIDQPQSTKKCIIIFGEYLKQSHEILIGNLYPLTLETFTRILKSSYSLFNILKNTKK